MHRLPRRAVALPWGPWRTAVLEALARAAAAPVPRLRALRAPRAVLPGTAAMDGAALQRHGRKTRAWDSRNAWAAQCRPAASQTEEEAAWCWRGGGRQRETRRSPPFRQSPARGRPATRSTATWVATRRAEVEDPGRRALLRPSTRRRTMTFSSNCHRRSSGTASRLEWASPTGLLAAGSQALELASSSSTRIRRRCSGSPPICWSPGRRLSSAPSSWPLQLARRAEAQGALARPALSPAALSTWQWRALPPALSTLARPEAPAVVQHAARKRRRKSPAASACGCSALCLLVAPSGSSPWSQCSAPLSGWARRAPAAADVGPATRSLFRAVRADPAGRRAPSRVARAAAVVRLPRCCRDRRRGPSCSPARCPLTSSGICTAATARDCWAPGGWTAPCGSSCGTSFLPTASARSTHATSSAHCRISLGRHRCRQPPHQQLRLPRWCGVAAVLRHRQLPGPVLAPQRSSRRAAQATAAPR